MFLWNQNWSLLVMQQLPIFISLHNEISAGNTYKLSIQIFLRSFVKLPLLLASIKSHKLLKTLIRNVCAYGLKKEYHLYRTLLPCKNPWIMSKWHAFPNSNMWQNSVIINDVTREILIRNMCTDCWRQAQDMSESKNLPQGKITDKNMLKMLMFHVAWNATWTKCVTIQPK